MVLETISSRDLLIHAYKFYLKGDARAYEAISIIKNRNDMELAVLGCLDRATKEEEPEQQKLNCDAACFGKKFHPGVAIDKFKSICKSIRVWNDCRRYIPEQRDPQEIIRQLLNDAEYDRALWVADWLPCDGGDLVISRWCEAMMQNKLRRDEEIASVIQQKLRKHSLVSFADIAKLAIEYNRIPVAIKLLENEDQTSKKIPLLLSIQQYDLVLTQAVATCDCNSIYSAIFKLKDLIGSNIRFLEMIKKHRHAFKYYCNFLAVTDLRKLIQTQHAAGASEDVIPHILSGSLQSALQLSRKTKQDFVSHQIELQIKSTKLHAIHHN